MKRTAYIASVVIFFFALFFFALQAINSVFLSKTRREAGLLLRNAGAKNIKVVTRDDLRGLPRTVRNWMRVSGVVGKGISGTVRLKQSGRMMKSADSDWMDFFAEQYYRLDRPEFMWISVFPIIPGIQLVVRDSLVDGEGGMYVALSSFFVLADVKGEEIDQGSMLRFLSEIVWFPSAALAPYMQWEYVDRNHARAILTYEGKTVEGIFSFNEDGFPDGFIAKRYREMDGSFDLQDWEISMNSYRTQDGFTVPGSGEAKWIPENSPDLTYFKGEILEIEYDIDVPYRTMSDSD